jgi:hypothetical protein
MLCETKSEMMVVLRVFTPKVSGLFRRFEATDWFYLHVTEFGADWN